MEKRPKAKTDLTKTEAIERLETINGLLLDAISIRKKGIAVPVERDEEIVKHVKYLVSKFKKIIAVV
tara:strand:- start:1616 stop:1816 length:201 start_codon:yes stop_codon:yes gene_type:complete